MAAYVDQANTGADVLVSSRSVTKPAGVVSGDVGVFWLARWEDPPAFPAVTPPSGSVLRSTFTGTNLQTLCYVLRVTGETSFNFTWTGSRWSTLSAVFFSGIDPALDFATAPFDSTSGSGSGITTLSVTTVSGAALAWHVNNISGSGGFTHTPPTSFTEAADVAQWSAAYRISPGAGSQSAAGASMSGSTAWAAGLLALAPASAGTDAPAAAATGTAAAGDAAAAVAPAAGNAAATAVAAAPAAAPAAQPGSAQATAAALDASPQSGAGADTAQGSVTALSATLQAGAEPGGATGAATAYGPSVAVSAPAGTAAGTAVAGAPAMQRPQVPDREEVSGREPAAGFSGREPVASLSGREPAPNYSGG